MNNLLENIQNKLNIIKKDIIEYKKKYWKPIRLENVVLISQKYYLVQNGIFYDIIKSSNLNKVFSFDIDNLILINNLENNKSFINVKLSNYNDKTFLVLIGIDNIYFEITENNNVLKLQLIDTKTNYINNDVFHEIKNDFIKEIHDIRHSEYMINTHKIKVDNENFLCDNKIICYFDKDAHCYIVNTNHIYIKSVNHCQRKHLNICNLYVLS